MLFYLCIMSHNYSLICFKICVKTFLYSLFKLPFCTSQHYDLCILHKCVYWNWVILHPYRLKLSCTIHSTHIKGFRNSIATVLAELSRRHLHLCDELSLVCIHVIFREAPTLRHFCLQCMHACCFFLLLFHCVYLFCIVFLYSLSATFCLLAFTSGRFFSVRLCSSTFILGVVLMLYWGFALVFYILRPCPHILFWGVFLVFYLLTRCPPVLQRHCPHCYLLRLRSSSAIFAIFSSVCTLVLEVFLDFSSRRGDNESRKATGEREKPLVTLA